MHGLRHHFLIAMPQLADDNFSNSLVYVCDDDEKGVLGVIVNRPLTLTVGGLLEKLELRVEPSVRVDMPVLYGGPVHTDRGFIVHRGLASDWESSLQVSDDIALTTSMDMLNAIARGVGPDEFVMLMGCAGWQVPQLTDELKDNAWLTVAADSKVIFDMPCDRRRDAAADLLGVNLDLLGSIAGHG
ncbi:hypothetical protein R84981_002993 [Carnimonas sp. R-84981]|uniref:YqgE/AlgH family protein n=1 Tax=Carnimonas bestiolae TaxID=3402172 RepID=UPI003EDB7B94